MKWKNLWIGLGVCAAVGTMSVYVSYASTKYLMRLALDREAPKRMAKKKIRGSDYGAEVENMLSDAARKLEAKVSERIEITGADGIRLVGHWYPCEEPRRVIVAMHGWRSCWSRDFGTIADFWHDSGCSILFAEQRGQNNSEGDYMGFGLLERFDCREWVNWVNEKCHGKLPIYLGGISMGATTVLMASGLPMPDTVHGIIADCGFTSPHAIWKHVVENHFHVPYGLYARAANDLCKKKIHTGSRDYSASDALSKTHIPVLFIHGTDDSFVPVEMTYENYKSCVSPKKLLIVPGANHGMSYHLNRPEYEKMTQEFWEEFDHSAQATHA